MSSLVYDYAIIGAGAAGLNLALSMLNDPFFEKKKILIIEKDDKRINDRTWCFWEIGNGIYDEIIFHQWQKTNFYSSTQQLNLNLFPYRYKMIRAQDFYEFCINQLASAPQFDWVKDEIIAVDSNDHLILKGTIENYNSCHIFDSRINPEFNEKKNAYNTVLQHFKGWFIKTSENKFNPEVFTIMDFRLKYQNSTSFIYLLPTAPDKALVEFTFFTPQLVEDTVYDEILRKYLTEFLKISDYQIEETEKGIIPMSTYPFHQDHFAEITKIGTAGGWVRPSSGYSFRNAQKNSLKIIENIKAGYKPSEGLHSKKAFFYDSLFLDILLNNNENGEHIFTSMYQKNDIKKIFKFLDNETTVIEDLSIISKLPWKPFMKALQSHIGS